MLVRQGRGCLYRAIFRYTNEEQRQKVVDYAAQLPGKVHTYDNEQAPNVLVCDFQQIKERNAFEAVKHEF